MDIDIIGIPFPGIRDYISLCWLFQRYHIWVLWILLTNGDTCNSRYNHDFKLWKVQFMLFYGNILHFTYCSFNQHKNINCAILCAHKTNGNLSTKYLKLSLTFMVITLNFKQIKNLIHINQLRLQTKCGYTLTMLRTNQENFNNTYKAYYI